MSNKTPAIIVSIVMVLLVGGIVTYAVVSSDSGHVARTSIPQSIASSGAVNQDSTTPALGLSSQGGSSIGLQSNLGSSTGSSTGSSSSSAKSNIPTPDQFSQYEQYKTSESAMFSDLVVGTGTEVAVGTKVAVTYEGWLSDGTMFDASQSDDQGKLVAFTLTIGEHKVIPGWEQGLVGMKVGGKRRLIVPPSVGYGAEGKDPIPPNSLLIFDIVLHDAL